MTWQGAAPGLAVSQDSASPYPGLAASLVKRIFTEDVEMDYAVRLWNGETIQRGTGGAPRFTLVLNHPGALRRMVWPRTTLGLGEAFQRGDFDVKGDLIAAVGLGERLMASPRSLGEWAAIGWALLHLPKGRAEPLGELQPAYLRGALHSRERDRAAVQYHYDLANEFYSLWLDSRMVYSCAYFATGSESLEVAQEAKLDLICRKLELQAGETLLDIGCGWGGLPILAASRYCASAVGLTLSDKQADFAQARISEAGLGAQVRVEVGDYRELCGTQFDKIVSVGMAEHVGRAKLPGYFAQAYRLVKPGGLFLIQAITAQPGAEPTDWFTRILNRDTFIRRYVFPDYEVVPVDVLIGFAEAAGFELRHAESLREHYSRTARHWLARLEAQESAAQRLVSAYTYRTWRLYLGIVAHAFGARRLNVHRVLLAKPEGAGPAVPRSALESV